MRRKIYRAPVAVAGALLLGVLATACSTEEPEGTTGTAEETPADGTDAVLSMIGIRHLPLAAP